MSWINQVDLTLLNSDALDEEYEELLSLARKFKVASVCVPPVGFALSDMIGSYRTTSVVNFPHGYDGWWIEDDFHHLVEKKVDEIDVVLPIGLIKNKKWVLLEEKLRLMRGYAKQRTLKGIIETPLLSTEEIKKVSNMLKTAQFDFVKTCTGWQGGVTLTDVALIRQEVGDQIGIKASGGIKTVEFAEQLLKLGATRLGIGLRSFREMVK